MSTRHSGEHIHVPVSDPKSILRAWRAEQRRAERIATHCAAEVAARQARTSLLPVPPPTLVEPDTQDPPVTPTSPITMHPSQAQHHLRRRHNHPPSQQPTMQPTEGLQDPCSYSASPQGRLSVAATDVTSVFQTDVTSAAPTDTLCLCSNVSVGPADIKLVWETDVTSVASGRCYRGGL
ncbi:hypothetical protein PCANC_22014 [Puccinia coronata f. sp. avenae]|uniref:Uncharacterized protein n=1 Tax=Puccinia coronata f. sp. avenae TaxID=200324 RepID=A0A2N5UHB0_9BASI|nr:hypothetical protein PCANC_22014 [Puccinia coronata f. sp. avenae]